MTDHTGRSFLSYRRSRHHEAALLIAAQHDHGIPTWQDIHDLASAPTEEALRGALRDPLLASAILFITPEVEDSSIIRDVELPMLMRRHEANDGFFVVPVAAGGLDYQEAARVTRSRLSAQTLEHWNMLPIANATLSAGDAATVARRVLIQRLQAVHQQLPPGEPLRVGLFVRIRPPAEPGPALLLDWLAHFDGKETPPETWRDTLLPALSSVAYAIGRYAPGRDVEAFGFPTLPAALALGNAFPSIGGVTLSWRQVTRGRADQVWSVPAAQAPSRSSGFTVSISGRDTGARDFAALVSVSDNAEPLFSECQASLPALRVLVQVRPPGAYPHLVGSPSEVADIALIVLDALRTARRDYGAVGTVHLFMAAPAGLAVLVGQLLNTFGTVQAYEHVPAVGYRPAALLHPSG